MENEQNDPATNNGPGDGWYNPERYRARASPAAEQNRVVQAEHNSAGNADSGLVARQPSNRSADVDELKGLCAQVRGEIKDMANGRSVESHGHSALRKIAAIEMILDRLFADHAAEPTRVP